MEPNRGDFNSFPMPNRGDFDMRGAQTNKNPGVALEKAVFVSRTAHHPFPRRGVLKVKATPPRPQLGERAI